ncbi:hypothetical protein JCM8208_007471 [Rhodotorula glutinis]
MPRRTLSLLIAALALVSLAHSASPASDAADIFLPEDSARQHAARPVVYTASSESTAPSFHGDADDAQAPLDPASNRVPLPFRLPHGPRRLKRSRTDLDAFPELDRRAEPNLADRASAVRASRSAAEAAGAGSSSSAVAPAPEVPETTTTARLPGSKGVVSTGLLTRATASTPAPAAATTSAAPATADEPDAASDGAGGATVTAFETASTGVVVTSFASASAGTLESALDGSASASSEPATALVNAAAGPKAASWAGVAAAGALVALAMH